MKDDVVLCVCLAMALGWNLSFENAPRFRLLYECEREMESHHLLISVTDCGDI